MSALVNKGNFSRPLPQPEVWYFIPVTFQISDEYFGIEMEHSLLFLLV